MTQSEANPSLDYGSLLAGKKAGNNAFFGLPEGTCAPKNDCSTSLFDRFPYSREQGNSTAKQGSTIDYARKPELWTVRSLESAKAHPLAAAQVKSRKGEALKPTTDADYDE